MQTVRASSESFANPVKTGCCNRARAGGRPGQLPNPRFRFGGGHDEWTCQVPQWASPKEWKKVVRKISETSEVLLPSWLRKYRDHPKVSEKDADK